jgi:hypothetical protein
MQKTSKETRTAVGATIVSHVELSKSYIYVLIFNAVHQPTTPAWLAQSVERETLRFHLLIEAIDPISRLRVRPPHRASHFWPFF